MSRRYWLSVIALFGLATLSLFAQARKSSSRKQVTTEVRQTGDVPRH